MSQAQQAAGLIVERDLKLIENKTIRRGPGRPSRG